MRRRHCGCGLASAIIAALVVAFLVVILVKTAFAQPVIPDPRVGESYEPNLSTFFSSLYNARGNWCCTSADTRVAPVRIKDGHFEAWIDEHYPEVALGTSAAGWYPIPDDAYVPDRENPLGEPVVSFYHGVVRCFLDAARG